MDAENWLEMGRRLRDAAVQLGSRRARYLAQASEKIDRLGLTRSELTEVLAVGWTKASRIASVATTRRDMMELVRRAEDLSVVDLENAVRSKEGRRRRPDGRRSQWRRSGTFTITCDQRVAARLERLLIAVSEERDMRGRPGWRGDALAVLVEVLEKQLGIAGKKGRGAA